MGTYGLLVLIVVLVAVGAFYIKRLQARYQRQIKKQQQLIDSLAQQNTEHSATKEQDQEQKDDNQTQNDFLSILSHELRAPVNAILGWSQLLKSDPHNEDLLRGLHIIDQNAQIQAKLISDLLDISRAIAGRLPLAEEMVDLRQILQTCIDTAKPDADKKQLQMTLNIQSTNTFTVGDASRLQQVFNNLINNAIKFTNFNDSISVSLTSDNKQFYIDVTDTGVGIEKDFLPMIFSKFTQAKLNTKHVKGSLGLGLAIVKNIIELHEGSINVFSQGKNCGSTFKITLPKQIMLPATEPRTYGSPGGTPTPITPTNTESLSQLSILIVDDEYDARHIISRILETRKAKTYTASSVPEAMKFLKEESLEKPIDLIISDIGMPEYDGYDFIAMLKCEPILAKIPTTALTAYARKEDEEKALRAGFAGFITKPVTPATLIEKVTEVAKKHGLI